MELYVNLESDVFFDASAENSILFNPCFGNSNCLVRYLVFFSFWASFFSQPFYMSACNMMLCSAIVI